MALREYSGNAKSTTLAGDISAAATSITVADGTGYPTGAVGPFVITIDAGLAGEEKVLCTSRTGNTFTVTSRGWDGTSAADHSNAAVVQHTLSATDIREANAHVNDTTTDVHPQYLTDAAAASTYAAAVDAVLRASVAGASVATSQTTTSAAYTDLATVGPAATVTIGASGKALVVLVGNVRNNTAGQFSIMSYAISGATTAAAQEDSVLAATSATADAFTEGAVVHLRTGLTPGSNTFTAKYRVSAGTGTFLRRHIIVIPL